jgi:hypothetical protein
MSVAKIAGLLYAVVGLAIGGFVSLLAMVGGAIGGDSGGSSFFPALFGVGSVILFPLFYGCLGFVMTAISAWLYNVVASVVGGVQLDVQ